MGSEDEEAGANDDAELDSKAPNKHRKMDVLTKCDDLYTVDKRREALRAKANKGGFVELRAVWPTKANAVFLSVIANLMSSAQIERDFSAASLVLPGNRGKMDAPSILPRRKKQVTPDCLARSFSPTALFYVFSAEERE